MRESLMHAQLERCTRSTGHTDTNGRVRTLDAQGKQAEGKI